MLTFGLGMAEAATYPFADDFESGLGNWTAEAPWGATTAYYSSPVSSATDSPSTYYGASVDASLVLASSIDLTSATRPVLRFYHRHQLEDGYDFGHVEISTDGGSTWTAPVASYTGASATWIREQIDLSSYTASNDVRIRFRLVSDNTVSQDGWYVDDVVIAEGPDSVTLDTPVTITPNSVDLTWDESLEADFSVYRIYRASTATFDWRDAALVAEIDDPAVLEHTDITVTPKTTFYYQIMVLTSSDLHNSSNEVEATTPAGMDYPFLDDGEGTGSAWSADPPWALNTEEASSGTHSWSDSPGGDYGDSIPSQSLTLVSPIDLTSAATPVLSFVHNWTFAAGDSGNAEISTDDGSSWTPLAIFTNGTSDGWVRGRFDLSSYTTSNDVLVRFRTTTDPSTGADGWYVDDISVAESPTVVDPPILDEITSHSMRLTWARCNDLLFSHYAIHRSAASDVGINSTMIAEISDQDTTTFTDTGLAVDTDYYYRVYAVSPYGTYSPGSTSASTDRTGGNAYPFVEDFEGSLESWNFTGDWDATDTDQHGGSSSLTDSPDTTSTPSTTWEARTTIDLTGSVWPVLRFWDRFALADDWGYLEVSTNGTSWSRVYSVTGARAAWSEQSIDLSPWKTSDNLRIRFTVGTGGSNVDDGWYIDDLSVAEHTGSISLPFFDAMEAGTGNWLVAAWAPSTDNPHDGTWSAQSTPQGATLDRMEHVMELAGELDLSAAIDPQLTYWVRGGVSDNGSIRVRISVNGGVTWTDVPGTPLGEYWSGDWTRIQASLAAYLQSGVRIRFVVTQGSYGGATNVFIDDVSIEEMPETVYLGIPTPHLKSVDLSWDESTLGDFDRYEVYRSTAANVTTGSTLVATFDTESETTFTDTGLSIGASYYYRVFVFNSRNVATPSNERSTTTVPLTFPFTDPMENLDNWDATGTWGPDGADPYEGSFSLNDSPGDNSAYSVTTYLLTAIDLSGSTWPVLRFQDRLGLANDWGYLEVSTNGTSWSRVYSVTGARAAWSEQSIDLSPWKTSNNLRIRFAVGTGGSIAGDGWYIDDLSVAEHTGGFSLPFFDDLEAGTGNWLAAAWAPSTDNPHDGTWSAQSTPQGATLDRMEHVMELAGELDLSAAIDPQLTYWVRGGVSDNGSIRVRISVNGGVTWTDVPGTPLGEYWSGDWTRIQASLAAYLQSGVRIRFVVTQGSYGGATNVFIDDVSIEEMPETVYLGIPTPHLKSVDLSWDESTLGDFDRYEVYRSTAANVTTGSTLVATFDTESETTFTDTGLSIGASYYYRVFVFNSRNVATPSNERSTTTVPLTFPFTDPMENLDNWDATGTWGPDGADPYEGSFSLNDSPGDNSAYSVTTYLLTAIDLSGSTWPVLRFQDRLGLANDWGYLEVSTNGTSWSRVYSVTGARAAWSEQSIDLSPWKTSNNLRIRFAVGTGGSIAGDGWYIDDLSVAEHTGGFSLPFFDDLEAGTGNWLAAAWAPSTDNPHDGTWSAQSTPQGATLDRMEHVMELAGELDLSAAIDPQLTYWVRGGVSDNGSIRVRISVNGGVTWTDVPGTPLGEYWSGDWTRIQASLAAYLQSGVRIRFVVTQGSYGGATNVFIDDVSIEEMPEVVTLATPDQITISSMRLQWNDLNDPDFKAYAIYRSPTSTVDTNSELITTITEQATTEFVDTGLQARTSYYYRVYFVDTADVHAPSNSTSAMTFGVTVPFHDDFESDSGVWTFTGEWGRVTDAGVGNSMSLGDSPGDFTSNVDTWAVTGVDLSGTTWPVVAFDERFDFAGHWGRFEVSSNGGANWTVLHGATTSHTGWVQRRFDLSPWRGQAQVWIRYFVDANSGVPADGWHIDNLYIGENLIEGSSSYPFFDGFEDGDGNWLQGGWTLIDDNPYEGSTSILDTPASRLGNSELWLTYGSELDLSSATDPLLTFQVRGNLPYRTNFRVEVSTDGGKAWQDLPSLQINYYWGPSPWVRMQTSLAGYLVTNLRLRFRGLGSYGGDENIFLDNIAVGEQTPGAPTLSAPAWGGDEPTVRPTLIVKNAIDYQSDLMNYEYQVFDDSELTNIVADVPAVAGGSDTTSWPVDEDLLPDTQYWWRCRATDDSDHTGPWMETATFFVQLEDHPPTVPVLLAPADGGELADLTGRLTWLESTDPDEDSGDYVASYRVQIDDDPAFGSIDVDVTGITVSTKATGALSVALSDLTGSDSLVTGTLYHWRVNAKDSHGVASDWSAGPTRFIFGSDEQAPTCAISSPADDATVTGTPITITGTASDDISGPDIIEISTDGGSTWTQAVGSDSWTHQWWPALSGDYELSCRATDLAENAGTTSTPITVHADLDRTMSFGEGSAEINEDVGSYNVTVTLSAARATEVTAELLVTGSASSGSDFDEPPQTIRFFPGQTTLVFPVSITDDDEFEGDETIQLTLGSTNVPDITIGAVGVVTLTILDNDVAPDPFIFSNGFEDGDLAAWTAHVP